MADKRVVTLSIIGIVATLFVLLNGQTYNIQRLAQDYPEAVVIMFFLAVGFLAITIYKK